MALSTHCCAAALTAPTSRLSAFPGAWEIPAAARACAAGGRVDAVVTLGCLLRGETAHYEVIYNEVGPRHRPVAAGDRRSSQLRRAHLRHSGAGAEPRRHQSRQQGLRGRRGRHRNGEPAPQTAARRFRLTSRHRRKSRELAMQMLFQADVGRQTPDEVRATFWKAGDPVEPEVCAFAEDLFRVALAEQQKIDALIAEHSTHWRLDRMPAVDRNLLRMAVAELDRLPSPRRFPWSSTRRSKSAAATALPSPSTSSTASWIPLRGA